MVGAGNGSDGPGASPSVRVLHVGLCDEHGEPYRRQIPQHWTLESVSPGTPAPLRAERFSQCDVIIHTNTPISADDIASAAHLRFVQRTGVGVDLLDCKSLHAKGIAAAVCTVGTEAAAEHAVMLMLAAGRHLQRLHLAVTAEGAWPNRTFRSRSVGMQGATVGLIGFGRIGQAVARLVSAFGAQVIVYRRPGRPMLADSWRRLGVTTTSSLHSLFAYGDFVSLHCPMVAGTRGMVNAALLSQMHDRSVLINTARGDLVIQADLVEALRRGRPMAAALDTLAVEPPAPDDPLLSLPNVLITPHTATGLANVQQARVSEVVGNVLRFVRGFEPANRVC